MKIFFSASVRGDKATIRKIYELIKKLGYQHTSDTWETDFPDKWYKISEKERNDHSIDVYQRIDKAQIAVMETSMPSFSVGQFIQYCLDNRIPVLALYKKGSPIGVLEALDGKTDYLFVAEYDESNMEKVIKEGIGFLIDALEVRFTLILPSKIIKYLDKIAKNGKTRSQHIRELIEKEMNEKI